MTNPNIVNTSDIRGRTYPLIATTTLEDFLTNASNSNEILKVNTVMVANITTSVVTADLVYYDNNITQDRYLAYGISVPPGSSIALIGKDTPIYVEESDKLKIAASAGSSLHFIVSYEVIS